MGLQPAPVLATVDRMSSHNRFAKDAFTGGKGGPGVVQKIINQIPPCRVLIEPFAGEATVAATLRPPAEIILVDKVRQPGLALPAAALKVATFIQGDGIAFLDGYKFRGDEFVYGDPPYLLRARSQRGRAYYANEMPDRDHRRWLRVAKAINCRVAISGYHSPLYDDELADWRRIEFEVMTRGGTKAMEVLWMNYPQPTELHDWSHVGDDKRARHRLRKKIRRALLDLMGMPVLERGALFHALSQGMKVGNRTLFEQYAENAAPDPAAPDLVPRDRATPFPVTTAAVRS